MSDDEETEVVTRLTKRTKQIQIDDQDVDAWELVLSAFYEHYQPRTTSRFTKLSSGDEKSNPLCLYSDLFCDETTVLCGFAGGACKAVDVNRLSSEEICMDRSTDWKHQGLSCLRCSRTSPSLFFSSSTNGTVYMWDRREETKKPVNNFAPLGDGNDASKSRKPVLQFDVSVNDQLLCGGTEMIQEDSYLLFWDVRSTKLLGAYWESHSDDVTAVRFHPCQTHCLASGSTDGLLNVFNLMEATEDDALQYSFNSNSSVDSIHWCTENRVTCVTHTNEVHVWNSNTGDPVSEIKRKVMAETMMRSNPDAVYISSCHNLVDTSRVGLMTCSLSGGSTRLIELNDEMKPTSRGLFLDQTAVIQTAQLVPKLGIWITFDENGVVKTWEKKPTITSTKKSRSNEDVKERKRRKRFKPYS